jgi:hypothetical protein
VGCFGSDITLHNSVTGVAGRRGAFPAMHTAPLRTQPASPRFRAPRVLVRHRAPTRPCKPAHSSRCPMAAPGARWRAGTSPSHLRSRNTTPPPPPPPDRRLVPLSTLAVAGALSVASPVRCVASSASAPSPPPPPSQPAAMAASERLPTELADIVLESAADAAVRVRFGDLWKDKPLAVIFLRRWGGVAPGGGGGGGCAFVVLTAASALRAACVLANHTRSRRLGGCHHICVCGGAQVWLPDLPCARPGPRRHP